MRSILLNERKALQPIDHQFIALVAHDRIDRPDSADDRLDLASELGDNLRELGDLLGGKAVGLGKDHGCDWRERSACKKMGGPSIPKSAQPGELGRKRGLGAERVLPPVQSVEFEGGGERMQEHPLGAGSLGEGAVGLEIPVGLVADDGEPAAGALDAKLVAPAGLRLKPDERRPRPRPRRGPASSGFPRGCGSAPAAVRIRAGRLAHLEDVAPAPSVGCLGLFQRQAPGRPSGLSFA